MKKTLIAAALSIFSVAAVVAQPGKFKNENHRIQQGVATGRITKNELYRLKAEESQLRKDIFRYKRDGHLTPWERKDLAAKQAQLDRNIYLQKNDGQRRH